MILQALAAKRSMSLPDGRTLSLAAPVILDLDGKGVTTLNLTKSGVRYDLDGDGLADQTSWIGTTEGFLFLDRDKDGKLSGVNELSFIGDFEGATSDLAGLKAFDSNADGLLSAADQRFGDFRIWQDLNGNGVAEDSEILSLTSAGVRSINLTAVASTGSTAPGDVAIVAKGNYTRTNGTTMDLLDAALTFRSAPRDGLPKLDVLTQSFENKAKKYRLVTKDGAVSVGGKGLEKGLVDNRAGGLAGIVMLQFRNTLVGMLSALVLDLDGNGVTMTKLGRAGSGFDMDGNGQSDKNGWIGPHDGFLVIDRNANGLIDDGSELTFLAEDPTARSSLAGLAKLDSNGDKVIDAKDARFLELRVWVDANANGITDLGELKTLASLGIVSIGLSEKYVNGSNKIGSNFLVGSATFTRSNGMVGTLGDTELAFNPKAAPVPGPTTPPFIGGGSDQVPIDPLLDAPDTMLGMPGHNELAFEAATTPIARPEWPAQIEGGPSLVPIESLFGNPATLASLPASGLPALASTFGSAAEQFSSAIAGFVPSGGTMDILHENPSATVAAFVLAPAPEGLSRLY